MIICAEHAKRKRCSIDALANALQWWTTIENHRYQWLPDPKHHRKSIVSNGCLQPFHSMVIEPLKTIDTCQNVNASKNLKLSKCDFSERGIPERVH